MKNHRVQYGDGRQPLGNRLYPYHRHDILRRVEIIPTADDDASNGNDCGRAFEAETGPDPAGGPTSASEPSPASFDAIGALSDMLDSANQIVEAMNRAGLSGACKPKPTLWIQVAECENKAADLLHRLARLRRSVFR